MILKRPYAFFIKNFKLFHLIIFTLSAILLYRTSLIYDFLKIYNKTSPNVIGKDLTSSLFSPWLYILILLIIIVNIIIIYILIRKDKPYMYYIVNISLYIAVLVVYIISHGIIYDLQESIVAAKTTLAIRDITNIARMLQTISIIFYLIRATGFDIKKFDFVRDLQGLDISEEDSEEIEVGLDFEKNVFIRDINKGIRNAKYYYKENKFILNIIILVFIAVIFFLIYLGTNKYDKVYNETQFINARTISLGIKETNVITKNYKNSIIAPKDKAIVAIKISLKGDSELQTTRAVLIVNGTKYYNINAYKNDLIDIGNVYNEELLTEEFTDYVLVYLIPLSDIKSQMKFEYVDNVEYQRGETKVRTIDVNLSPKYLDDQKETEKQYNLNDTIELENYKINISNYELNDKFVNKYNNCITQSECYDFNEIIVPSVREKTKAVLKIEGNLEYTESINKISNISDLIEKYGVIEYTYNGNSYEEAYDFNEIKTVRTTEDNVYYIEVDKEILNAEKINLSFKIRNDKYTYTLRGE